MKAIAWLAGIATLLAGAAYMIVSLNRWEWNRALFFGLIVLIAEVGLATPWSCASSGSSSTARLRTRTRWLRSAAPAPRHPIASNG